jgi:hypothetical protein
MAIPVSLAIPDSPVATHGTSRRAAGLTTAQRGELSPLRRENPKPRDEPEIRVGRTESLGLQWQPAQAER